MKYNYILWDFDGTLAYTGADVWGSLEYAAQKCGGTIPAQYRKDDSNLGKSVWEIFHQVTPFPGEDKYEEYDELVRIHYRTISEYPGTCLYEGIRELLLRLREKGAVNSIITMKPREALERILDKKGWGGYFEERYSPDSFSGTEKTKSELIRHVIEREPDKSYVYIGDTWSDVRAAHDNGIPCIAVTYGDGDTEKLTGEQPEYIADDVSGIADILEKGV